MIAFASSSLPDPRQLLLVEFIDWLAAQSIDKHYAPRTADRRRIAANHLAAVLDRPPVVTDLADDNIRLAMRRLESMGRRPATVEIVRRDLAQLGRLAARHGFLEYAPIVEKIVEKIEVKRERARPFTVAELNAILGSARTMPDDVAGVPARHWWFALVLIMLDTAATFAEALAIRLADFDRRNGRLTVGSGVWELHPFTLEAIEQITVGEPEIVFVRGNRREVISAGGPNREKLLPWNLDGGKPPYHMAYREFRRLLFHAGLAYSTSNLFWRLRHTAEAAPEIIERLNPKALFKPRLEKLTFPRPRGRREAEAAAAGDKLPMRGFAGAERRQAVAAAEVRELEVFAIAAFNPERALMCFFHNRYRPVRLVSSAPVTITGYLTTIRRFTDFLANEATIDNLTEDCIERFMAWRIAGGRAPDTANGDRACLLALANFAWKKRLLNDQIREVEKIRCPKRLPTAWTLKQLGAMLREAAKVPGSMSGIPAGVWWPGLILTIYETGLRLYAALALRSEDLKPPFVLARAETQKQLADQTFALHPETIGLLLSTSPGERQLLFPTELGQKGLHRQLRLILEAAGLPHSRRDLFHKIRRSSASHLARVAGDEAASKHLGHSDIHLTRKRYIDPTLQDYIRAADVLPRPDWR